MANVQLTISALPAHVRTARLLATAVARRAGIAETTLDEVRLAVGEACSRAVEAHRLHCPDQPISLDLIDTTDAHGSGTSGAAAEPGGGTVPVSTGVNGDGAHTTTRATHGSGRFEVIVSDRVPASEAGTDSHTDVFGVVDSYLDQDTPAGGVSGLPPDVGLAVIMGLADHVTIEPSATGTMVRLSWPLGTSTIPAEGTTGQVVR